MKILIIEDELELLELILRYFKKEGYRCEQATTFRDGFIKINNYEYDCAIIDLNLPGGDGLKLVQTLRADNTQTGIIIISARDQVDDRVSGLESGADDYLTKPFHLSELNARVKAVIRRKTDQYDSKIIHGDMVINMDTRLVSIKGIPITFTKKEYEILIYLVRNKNRVVTKDSIAEHLWGDYMDEAVSYDFIYAHVKNLRKKLVANGCGDFLKTVYGVGYKFVVA